MKRAIPVWILSLAFLSFLSGCGSEGTSSEQAQGTFSSTNSAVIVGSLVGAGVSVQGAFQAADAGCPNVNVTLNGNPVDIVMEDDCTFLVSNVQPSEIVVLGIELLDQGISGTIELRNVVEGELIEILVEAGFNSLAISVVRREEPQPVEGLPEVITDNKVTIFLPAGLYEQDLTVNGNKFTLVGEAGDACDQPEAWTAIGGKVVINKNNATFRNIAFLGPVEVRGNNARFIHCCFKGVLVIFGNNTDLNGGGGDEGQDEDQDDDD
jgi:hypothetical protein